MYTTWAAYLQHAEKDRGSIEVGKLGDFVVLDRDYLSCPEDQIKDIAPVMTITAGLCSTWSTIAHPLVARSGARGPGSAAPEPQAEPLAGTPHAYGRLSRRPRPRESRKDPPVMCRGDGVSNGTRRRSRTQKASGRLGTDLLRSCASSGAGVSSGWTRTPACLSEAAARRSIGRIQTRRSVAWKAIANRSLPLSADAEARRKPIARRRTRGPRPKQPPAGSGRDARSHAEPRAYG